MHPMQGCSPRSRLDDRLRDIPGHRREIDLRSGQRRRITVNPAHAIRPGLGSGDLERSVCGVQADDLDATLGQKQRERAGAAPKIHYVMRTQLMSDVGIHVQINAVRIQCVVDRRQSRMLKDRIGHASQGKHQ